MVKNYHKIKKIITDTGNPWKSRGEELERGRN
jgi:hypothetical protein